MRDSAQEIEAFDVAYFMASVDAPETNKAFAEENRATFPVLSDPDRAVSTAYGVLSERGMAKRWTYYVDPEGVIARIDREVDPRTAGADLVRDLDSLGVPRKDL
ncbi:MAG: peroxiredoxin family protein [Gammaproteobacteria bacterium]|nr:peroxiredoxin family protein [Gammaproteobacteria bacterium]MYE80512.1 peroxiredoxin family protein [Gammaproteobacteria bacterium]